MGNFRVSRTSSAPTWQCRSEVVIFFRFTKKGCETSKILIIVLIGARDSDLHVRIKSMGSGNVLNKPVDRVLLLEEVVKCIELNEVVVV